ncbi:PREDICTED: platelet-derived growth factor subunit B-like [Nicrophorus vespilloides]|uniref:Platelet-derived growth factor subunit B-like n=1 Tax=Nicrophorus vespilloides TaxID=110193 RepID=A0ABM1MD73_NICVS|nr:PREDICTED: platelet-derived growth factor subunit B-like [Nicrophorus vespilloides]
MVSYVSIVSSLLLINYVRYSRSALKDSSVSSNARQSENDAIVFLSDDDHDHQHHHHHYHDHTHDHDANPLYRTTTRQGDSNNDDSEHLKFFQSISSLSVNDLLLSHVDGFQDDEPNITNRFGENVERSAAITPKAASCMPELQTVELMEKTDPSIVYIPTCTRIERCGGCCSHKLLSCQPTDTETVSFKVIKTQFGAGNRLKFVGKELVHLEKHTKCACNCKVQSTDCNKFQEYRQEECRCICNNIDEEKKCHQHNKTKLWDSESCRCVCREISNCSSGFVFDPNLCKCMPIPVRRRFAEDGSNNESILPPSVVYETEKSK